MSNFAELCDSSLLSMIAKDKKLEVFSYFKKLNVNFLLEVILFL